jgi:hypothetical protein
VKPRRLLVVVVVLALLFGLPGWTLLAGGTGWPGPVSALGAVLFLAAAVALPVLMVRGHGRRGSDAAARTGDTLLGVIWVLFSWSVIGNLARLVLAAGGVPDPTRARVVAVAVPAVALVLAVWGVREALRLPRIRTREVTLPGLGAGLDGLRLVVVTDTHFGSIDRTRWSRALVATVNAQRPDLLCHVGDLADGPVARRRVQVDPLADAHAELGRFYVTGNHEYFSEAQGWLDHMAGLGWQPLANAHRVVGRGGDRLVVAGVHDRTGGQLPGHAPDLSAALAGADPGLPVVLLAHQPRQVTQAVAAGVALQLSGHTHGGQIWPFHYLVRTDQPVLAGLSRHGRVTQLYTSRGSGFWGPPLRVFAPSEIAVLILRSG